MRKILVILLGCLVAFSAGAEESREETFVNPIFYKGMINRGFQSHFVKITPTSYYEENCYGYRTQVKCELKENTEHTVVLRCVHETEDKNDERALIIAGYDSEPQVWTYEFVIRAKDEQTSTEGTYVRKMSFYEDEKEPTSYFGLFIYNSKEKQDEEWESITNACKETNADDALEN